MKLLPYETFTLHTPDSLPQVIQRLEAYIEAPRLFRWKRSVNRPSYQGTLSTSGFKLHRIMGYNSSSLPMIQGRFKSVSNGTQIRIAFKLHPCILFVILLWYSIWFALAILPLLEMAVMGDVSLEALFPLGGPLSFLCLLWCMFWFEVPSIRYELTQLIQGEGIGEQTWLQQAQQPVPRGSLTVAIAGILLFIFGVAGPEVQRYFLPSIALKECTPAATHSPYCNFSVLHTLTQHPTASALALSPDGQTLVSGGQDKAIKVWDLPTGQLRKTLQSDSGTIEALAIAPDGQTVVSGGGDRMVRVWNIASDRRPQLLKGHSSQIQQVTLSLDGKTLVSTTQDELKVWDLATGQLKISLPNFPPAEIKIGSFSIPKPSPSFFPLAIAPNCETALVGLGSRLVAWDLRTNQQTVLKKAHLWNETIDSASIGQDGKTALTVSYQRPALRVKVWDLTAGTLKVKRSVAPSSNESYLYPSITTSAIETNHFIGSLPEGLLVWNLKTAELEAVLKEPQKKFLTVSQNGKYLASIQGKPESGNATIKVLKRS